MSESRGTFELFGRHLTEALRPFRDALRDDAAFRSFMRRLGWKATARPPAYASIGVSIDGASLKLDGLGAVPGATEITALVEAAKNAYDSLQAISAAPPGVDAGAFLAEIRKRL